MARADSKWMPLYIGDYLADTSHLSRAQHGSYLLLLMAYWRRGGALPADDTLLAQIAKCTAKEWQADKPVLADLFLITGQAWTQPRADRELAKASANTKAKAEAGAKGAAKRWQADSTAINQPKANASQIDAPLPSPSQSPIGDTAAKAAVAHATKPTKGSRLANDWSLDADDFEEGRKLSLDAATIYAVAAQFRDHWRAKSGKDGVKSDWRAAWRNWLKNHIGYHGTGPWPAGRQSHGNRPGPASIVAAGAAVLSRMENGAGFRPDGSGDVEGHTADGGSDGYGPFGGPGGPILDAADDAERGGGVADPFAHRDQSAA